MSTSKDQVTRMLALVPYLRGNGGIPVRSVAADFGVPTRQIIKDLNVLWFCGLPEAVTGEMIDVDMEALTADGVVYIDNAEFLQRPVRLTEQEAVSLIVALRALRSTATDAERTTIDSALAKLSDAAGEAARSSALVDVHLEEGDRVMQGRLAEALATRRRLHLTYLVPSRDERTERDVDPVRLITAEGRTYLEAWCYRAQDTRLFRLDRIAAAEVLDVSVDTHDGVAPRDVSAGVYQPGEDASTAVLDLHPNAQWITEYYQVDLLGDGAPGTIRVRMRAGDDAWLRRFVLRQGGNVTVVGPPGLAAAVVEDARLALAAYDE